jgi:DNA-binding NarL/FixJ family response regulator
VIRVLIDVSSPALRAGLRALLSSDRTLRIVNDSLEDQKEADVVITSASYASFSANGGSDSPSKAILFLSDEPLDVRDIKRTSSAWGILQTDASPEELSAAVHALSQGLIVGASTLLFESENGILSQGPLTDRESEVLGLLSRGLANKQIAAALGISEHTVKFHVSSIYQKLNVTNRTEAVREGLRGGWIAL